MKNEIVKRFSVVMPLKLYEAVRIFAFKNNHKFAEAIRILIKQGLEKAKDG